MKRLFSVALVACGMLAGTVVTANAATVSWGALATSGTGICVPSCSNISTEKNQGGGMSAIASTEIIDSKGETRASATLSGISYLPTLKAYAKANDGPNYVRSTATGVQSYSNTGGNRTITLFLDLDISSLTGSAEANGQVAVFLTDELSQFSRDFGTTAFEIGSDTRVTSTQLLNSPNFSNMTAANTQLSFDVAAGQSFLIWAGLQAEADTGGLSDVFSTFTMNFEDGSDLLASSAAVIPLPAGVWLLLSALGGLGFAGWSRRGRKYQRLEAVS